MLVSALMDKADDYGKASMAAAIYKATGDNTWLDVEDDYSEFGLIKVYTSTYVCYHADISDPKAFVSKCFGDNFSTDCDTRDNAFYVTSISWCWIQCDDEYACLNDYSCEVPDDMYPDVWDKARAETTIELY